MARIVLLGGHGKVAMKMTSILAAKAHTVFSVIRDSSQTEDILSLGPNEYIKPTVHSLETSSDAEIQELLKGVDWVIWSAGAGGKGGAERTRSVDELAAKRYISAALAAPSVKKFLMVSALISRHNPAPWWDEASRASFKQGWEAIPAYCEAKLAADEFLYKESRKAGKEGWEDINLRPGTLLDKPGSGKVDLGKSRADGGVPREDVAAVGVELLEKGGSGGLWLDLVAGQEGVTDAVERVVREKVTTLEDGL